MPQNVPDYNWFRFIVSAGGTFSVTTDTTLGGPLETHLFTLENGVTLDGSGQQQ